jgi:hypothetical protein
LIKPERVNLSSYSNTPKDSEKSPEFELHKTDTLDAAKE